MLAFLNKFRQKHDAKAITASTSYRELLTAGVESGDLADADLQRLHRVAAELGYTPDDVEKHSAIIAQARDQEARILRDPAATQAERSRIAEAVGNHRIETQRIVDSRETELQALQVKGLHQADLLQRDIEARTTLAHLKNNHAHLFN